MLVLDPTIQGAKRPTTLPYAIVGASPDAFIAHKGWIPGLASTGAYRMAAACASRNEANATWFAESYGLDPGFSFHDYRGMLRRLALESATDTVLCLCTPTGLHAEQIVAALEKGYRYILADKPFVSTWDQMREVAKAAAGKNAFIGVSFQHIYNAPVFAMAEMVAKRRADVAGFEAFFLQGWLATNPNIRQSKWRLAAKRCGLEDIGSHSGHMASFVTGSPIAAVEKSLLRCDGQHGCDVYDNGVVTLRMANGLTGTVEFSQVMAGKSRIGTRTLSPINKMPCS